MVYSRRNCVSIDKQDLVFSVKLRLALRSLPLGHSPHPLTIPYPLSLSLPLVPYPLTPHTVPFEKIWVGVLVLVVIPSKSKVNS